MKEPENKMDGNKDESEKCIAIALKYIRTGDRGKALKFLSKADKLYPSKHAKELINQLSSANGSAASGEEPDNNEGSSAAGDNMGTRYRGGGDTTPDHHVEAKYTPEQISLVRKIQKHKENYYDVLGVTKECTEDDLKKCYRKLALKLHPDKNQAPGATEAFKMVGKAFATLNDTEKRRRYDLYGSDADRSTSSHSHHHHHRQGGTYYYDDEDISAEEIFNMFFGGGYPSGRVNRHQTFRTHTRTTNQNQQQQADPILGMVMQLSPVLLLVAMSVLGAFLAGDSYYNFEPTSKYSHERATKNLGVLYYVKPDFHTEYKGSLRKLEHQIEEEYVSNLRNNCFRERSYKENMAWRARNFGDGRLYEKAQNLKTPACDKLQELYGG